MNFKFTPRTIKELEDKAKKPIADCIQEFSLSTILLFVMKGLNCNEDMAYAAIEEYLGTEQSDGVKNDTMDLYLEILEALKASGFLPKQVNLEQMKDNLRNLGK